MSMDLECFLTCTVLSVCWSNFLKVCCTINEHVQNKAANNKTYSNSHLRLFIGDGDEIWKRICASSALSGIVQTGGKQRAAKERRLAATAFFEGLRGKSKNKIAEWRRYACENVAFMLAAVTINKRVCVWLNHRHETCKRKINKRLKQAYVLQQQQRAGPQANFFIGKNWTAEVRFYAVRSCRFGCGKQRRRLCFVFCLFIELGFCQRNQQIATKQIWTENLLYAAQHLTTLCKNVHVCDSANVRERRMKNNWKHLFPFVF